MDDERNDLAMISDSFRSLSEGRWQVHAAVDATEALETLTAGNIQLVVLAINSAALDISLLLGSFRRHPARIKTVVMASTATAEKHAASLAGGADLIFEKPMSPDGLKAVFSSVSALAGWTLPEVFQTDSRSIGLADLVQMECLARNSSVLELFREQSLGRIYVEDGQIIHAVCGEISGERGFQKLLALAGGTFELHDFEQPPERTINRTWEFLLGEAARQKELLIARDRAADVVSNGNETTGRAPIGKVSELLICSVAGEVHCNWQCADASARLTLLQEISARAEPLIPRLQLGKMDRLEIQLAEGRAILQPRADRLVFVRVADPKETHER